MSTVIKTFVVGLVNKNLTLEEALAEMLSQNGLVIKYSEKLPCTIRKNKFSPPKQSSQLFYYVVFKKRAMENEKDAWMCRTTLLKEYNNESVSIYPSSLFANSESNAQLNHSGENTTKKNESRRRENRFKVENLDEYKRPTKKVRHSSEESGSEEERLPVKPFAQYCRNCSEENEKSQSSTIEKRPSILTCPSRRTSHTRNDTPDTAPPSRGSSKFCEELQEQVKQLQKAQEEDRKYKEKYEEIQKKHEEEKRTIREEEQKKREEEIKRIQEEEHRKWEEKLKRIQEEERQKYEKMIKDLLCQQLERNKSYEENFQSIIKSTKNQDKQNDEKFRLLSARFEAQDENLKVYKDDTEKRINDRLQAQDNTIQSLLTQVKELSASESKVNKIASENLESSARNRYENLELRLNGIESEIDSFKRLVEEKIKQIEEGFPDEDQLDRLNDNVQRCLLGMSDLKLGLGEITDTIESILEDLQGKSIEEHLKKLIDRKFSTLDNFAKDTIKDLFFLYNQGFLTKNFSDFNQKWIWFSDRINETQKVREKIYSSLENPNWITGDVINAYLRSCYPLYFPNKEYFFNTRTMKVMQEINENKLTLKEAFNKFYIPVQIKEMLLYADRVVFPLCINDNTHWIVLVVESPSGLFNDTQKKSIFRYMDPLKRPIHKKYIETFIRFVQLLMKNKQGMQENDYEIQASTFGGQENNYDCGVWVLGYIDYLMNKLKREDFNAIQFREHVRRKIKANEILNLFTLDQNQVVSRAFSFV